MHELLAPIVFVLHCDHQAFQHASETASPRSVPHSCETETPRLQLSNFHLHEHPQTLLSSSSCSDVKTVKWIYLGKDQFHGSLVFFFFLSSTVRRWSVCWTQSTWSTMPSECCLHNGQITEKNNMDRYFITYQIIGICLHVVFQLTICPFFGFSLFSITALLTLSPLCLQCHVLTADGDSWAVVLQLWEGSAEGQFDLKSSSSHRDCSCCLCMPT